MASKSSAYPGETGHLYRYRTAVLIGPWRKSARRALFDAIHANQARRDEHDHGVIHWVVPGRIEEMETNED